MRIISRGRSVAPVALAFAALGLLLSSAALSQASIVDFQKLVQAESTLQSHYTFDGDNDTARLADSGSTNKTLSVSSGTATYTDGFGSSKAADTAAFGGYRTFGNAFSEATTVEYIINPSDTTTDGTFVAAAYIGGGGDPDGRLYFGKPTGGALKLASGPNNNTVNIIDASDYKTGNWYYVAVSIKEIDGDWVTNAWYANLSDGDTTLTHSVVDNTEAVDGSVLPATGDTFGVGHGMFDGKSNFLGSIDELTLHNAALTETVLQSHLDSITTPQK